MFEKLTPRERKLAYGVLALLPFAIIFVGLFSFIKTYNENEVREIALIGQVGNEELLLENAKKAQRRRAYYDSISLPSNLADASNDYQSWMKRVVRDELQMTLKSLTPRDAGDLKHERQLIGKRSTYVLTAMGNLEQLTAFLARFYSSDMLHRINSLKITPQNETAGSDKKIRTGQLSISAQIEVLALTTAINHLDFIEKFRAEKISASDLVEANIAFKETVIHRDIFGPPNNTPTINIRPSSSYTSDTEAKISVTANDADDEDELTYTIVESSVDGATLEPSKPGSRTGRLIVPGQKAGKFNFKIKVVDNGFPPKETIEDVSVKFEDKVVEKKPDPPKPDPPFINAKQTEITGIVLDRDGDWRVWIRVRTTPDRYKLRVGESFELDNKEWVVHSIKPHEAVIRVDNKLLTFKPSDRFTDPRAEVELAPPSDVEKSSEGAKAKVESDAAPKPRASA